LHRPPRPNAALAAAMARLAVAATVPYFSLLPVPPLRLWQAYAEAVTTQRETAALSASVNEHLASIQRAYAAHLVSAAKALQQASAVDVWKHARTAAQIIAERQPILYSLPAVRDARLASDWLERTVDRDADTSTVPAEGAVEEIQRLAQQGLVSEARTVAERAASQNPHSAALARWKKVLAPPRVRLAGRATGRHRHREQVWLREHALAHRGQWVALIGDELVACGADLASVRKRVSEIGLLSKALLHFVPREPVA